MPLVAERRIPSTRVSLAVVYAGYSLRYLSLLILIPYYSHVLGSSEYGKVLGAMSLFNVVWAVSNYGFSPVGARNVATVHSDAAALCREFGRHLSGRLRTGAVGLLIGVVGTMLSPLLREEPALGVLATLAGVVAGFNLGWFYQGVQRYTVSIGIEVLALLLNVLFVLNLVKSPSDGSIVLASLLVSGLASTIVAYVIALRRIGKPVLGGAESLIREATPLFLLGGISNLTMQSSTYLLSFFVPAQQVGWFGSAERLAAAILGLFAPAGQVMVGTVSSRLRHEAGSLEGYKLMARGVVGLMLVGLAALLGTLIFAPWVVPHLLGTGFGPSVGLLQTLAIMLPFSALTQSIGMYVLVPLRKETTAVRISLVGVALHLAILLAFAGHYGASAAAWARVSGEVFTGLMLVYFLPASGLLTQMRQQLNSRRRQ